MKKTALTQLIEQWEESKPKGSHGLIWQVFIDEASELLETEREQIEAAYVMGRQDQRCDMMPEYYNRSKQQYYKDTYQ